MTEERTAQSDYLVELGRRILEPYNKAADGAGSDDYGVGGRGYFGFLFGP